MIYFIGLDVSPVHTHHRVPHFTHSHPQTDMRATAISNYRKWIEILGMKRSR